MKKLTKLFIIVFLFAFQYSFSNIIFDNNDKEIEQILTELSAEINTTKKYYGKLKQKIYQGKLILFKINFLNN